MSENTYEVEIECRNCKERKVWSIPKGMTIQEFKLQNKCLYCGCYYL